MTDTTKAMRVANPVPNSVVLMFILGWQGGTIHQVAAALRITTSEIQNADFERMEMLMRQAQQAAIASQKGAQLSSNPLQVPETGAQKIVRILGEKREEFVTAFIAETGLLPSEAIMIEQRFEDRIEISFRKRRASDATATANDREGA